MLATDSMLADALRRPSLDAWPFTFVDLPRGAEGRSRIGGLTVFLSVEDRAANLLGGFDSGRDEDFERLDEVLAQARVAS
jgi:hypothetical protein